MIEVKELSFSSILNSISFSIPTGSSLAVIGHNGAGKTTLFHVLLGLKFSTSGTFTILEKKVGYVPERPYLEMDESFISFLKLHFNLIQKKSDDQQAEILRVASLVGLQDDLEKKFKYFSKGMLQKALLAQAILSSPELIFLDEPMSGLDPESRKELHSHLLKLKAQGVSLVFSSHVMEDVASLADQVLELDHGKQTFFGALNDWRAK